MLKDAALRRISKNELSAWNCGGNTAECEKESKSNMRVTSGMINRRNGTTARDRMISRNGTKQNKTGGMERLASMGASRAGTALKRTERAGFERLENAADQLTGAAEQLGRRADNGADCAQEAQQFVEAYNSAMNMLDGAGGVLNNYYRQMMRQAYSDNARELEEVGITGSAAGKLALNWEKLKEADPELVKKLLGTTGDFARRAGSVAARVSDNARANIQSLSAAYNARGDILNSYLSRYNQRG